MTRAVTLALVGIAAITTFAAGQKPELLFRYIALSPQDSITLGTPFRAFNRAIRINPTLYELKPGTFGGAERIRVIVDARGFVTTMEFQYAEGTKFAEKLQEYSEWLGNPNRSDSSSRRHIVAWQDSRTRFELSVARIGDREFVATQMVDVEKR